jgi:hypothetical protein
MKLESMRHRALDIAQDTLNDRQVLFVYMKTRLLSGVDDVRAREGEVPKSMCIYTRIKILIINGRSQY